MYSGFDAFRGTIEGMQSKTQTVAEYVASLPEDRRPVVSALRDLIKTHLPKGYKEGMDFGMICYYIPLETYPRTYNGHPLCYLALASQKNYLSLYLMGTYGQKSAETWLKDEFAKAGKKLDMGKSCVRFKTLKDLPLDTIARAVAMVPPEDFISQYEASRQNKKG